MGVAEGHVQGAVVGGPLPLLVWLSLSSLSSLLLFCPPYFFLFSPFPLQIRLAESCSHG